VKWIEAIMSQYYRQMQHGNDEARRLLNERLAREEMGDEAYDRMVSNNDDRAFKIFGVAFIALFAVVIFTVSWLGY
jgi:hypothetical protein